MKSIVAAAAVLLALPARSWARHGPPPPPPPAPPAPPTPPTPPCDSDDDEDSDDDDCSQNMNLHLDMNMDLSGLRDLPRAIARAMPGHRDGDDEDDADDEVTPAPDTRDDNGQKVRIYKLDKMREKMRELRRRQREMRHGRDDDDDEDDDVDHATAQAKGRGSATLKVSGPVTFRVRAQAGDIEITQGSGGEVRISVTDAPPDEVALYAFGDRVEPSFRGRSQLRRGKLHVELPRGSSVDLTSMSGDVSVQRVGGEVRIHTMSGDIKLVQVGKADVQTISGDTRIDDAQGPVRLHTVSGKGVVSSSGAAPEVEFQSASGDLDWSGVCGKDCHVSAETVSGDLRLNVDPKSSFELSYSSHSGEMRDELELSVKHAPRRKHGMTGGWLEATYGKGEGVIEADAFSGNLVVRKR